MEARAAGAPLPEAMALATTRSDGSPAGPSGLDGTVPPDRGQEQPLVVPQLAQTKHDPARCMALPHW